MLYITLKEHNIDSFEGVMPICQKQQKLAPEQVEILKKEPDQLLEASFVIWTWVSPMEIVPKENGKWCLYVLI